MADSKDERTIQDVAPTLLIEGATTGGKLALLEVRVRRDCLVPLHLHHWEDEIVYVLEGEVLFYLDGKRRPGPAGSCVLLPRGSEHAYTVESTEARLLIIVAPAGLEQLYDAQAQSSPRSTSTLEWLVTTGAKYGIEVTGPPLSSVRRNGHRLADVPDEDPATHERAGGSDVN